MDAWARVFAAARRDWIRRWRDPFAFVLWLGIPLVIGGLIVLATGGRGGASPRAKLLVASHDDGVLSDLLVQALSSERAAVIDAETVDEDEGRRRLDAGEASALLVIPAGFSAAVWNEFPTKLELVTNPAQRILPGIVEETLAILAEGVFYAHRVFGDEVREITASSFLGGELETARAAVAMRHDIERISKYVFPPAIEVVSVARDAAETEAKAKAPARGVAGYFLPAMLTMALMFMAEGLADDVWRERVSGALRRTLSTPFGVTPSLVGKFVAAGALMLLVSIVALGVAAAAFDVALWRALLAACWVACAGVVFLGLLTLLKLWASSQRAAGVLGNLVLFPLLMLGGCFMPFAWMPDWLARIGRFTPNGWAVTQLDAVLFGEFDASTLGLSFAGAIAVASALAMLGARRIDRVFGREA